VIGVVKEYETKLEEEDDVAQAEKIFWVVAAGEEAMKDSWYHVKI